MLDYLTQFRNLETDIKQGISTPGVVSAIKNLEDKYQLSLAEIIMRIMIKNISPYDFITVFIKELGLSMSEARELATDLKHSVFFGVRDYIYGTTEQGVTEVNNLKVVNKKNDLINTDSQLVKDNLVAKTPELAIDSDFYVANDNLEKPEEVILADKINQLINKTGLVFAASDLRKRLEKILAIYIKGIRSRIITKETLMREVALGGAGLKEIEAVRLLDLADGKNIPVSLEPVSDSKLESAGNENRPSIMDLIETSNKKLALSGSRDIDYDFTSLVNKTSKNNLEASDEKLLAPVSHNKLKERTDDDLLIKTTSKITSSDMVRINKVDQPKTNYQPLGSLLENSFNALAEQPSAVAVTNNETTEPKTQGNWQKTDSGKPVLADVLAKPRVYSPIDELRFMTIKNFRNLSKNPEQASDFIFKKIKDIIEEDYNKKIEAVTAWKQSPVNRMYVEVCKVGLMEGQPVAKILTKKQKEDPSFLTNAEFEAIILLNKNLTANI